VVGLAARSQLGVATKEVAVAGEDLVTASPAVAGEQEGDGEEHEEGEVCWCHGGDRWSVISGQ
jgi:hypothetical protein